jgi:putative nucleotidyltransferase with HDIG domain
VPRGFPPSVKSKRELDGCSAQAARRALDFCPESETKILLAGAGADKIAVPRIRGSAEPFLVHALVATFAVIVLPALAVSFIETSGRPWLVLLSVLAAMALSVAAGTIGSALWTRHPNAGDLVFGDLMLWGWVRRVRAQRRLAEATGVLGSGAASLEEQGLSPERRRKVLQRLAAMLEAKDTDTVGHSRRVTRHVERIAREMGLPREEVVKIRIAASVHDIGKVHTPRDLLMKPGKLTNEEFEVMKRHPVDGARMVAELGDPEITAMVRHHHERLDGSGYPDGLRGDEIPLGARIISVADTFDAITSSRAYHGARKHQRGLDVVSEEAGSRLDPDAVTAFLRYYTGKRSVAWSALGLTGPPRVGAWLAGAFNGLSGLASPLAQSFAAIAAAALAGVSLGGPPAPATASDRATPGAAGVDVAATTGGGVDLAAGGRGERRSAPLRDRPVSRPRQNSPGDGSSGQPAPPGGTGGAVPSTPVPSTPLPVPNVGVPGPGQPAVDVPDVQLPAVGVPALDAPQLTVPEVRLPAVEVPALQVPLSQVVPGLPDVDVQLPR